MDAVGLGDALVTSQTANGFSAAPIITTNLGGTGRVH